MGIMITDKRYYSVVGLIVLLLEGVYIPIASLRGLSYFEVIMLC